MKFTDDDLKQLKDAIERGESADMCAMPALLSRLEAAEKVCYVLTNTGSINAASAWDLLGVWRKVAGKDVTA